MRWCIALILACELASVGSAVAAEQGKENAAASKETAQQRAFLGLGIGEVPSAVRSQLPGLLEEGRGVLVNEVASGSPAEKAGVKQDDIIVSYDDQRVDSPSQFSRLVRQDKPDREAKLEIVRAGKSQEIKVTLGAHPAAAAEGTHESGTGRRTAMRPNFRPLNQQEQDEQWQTFDALTLSRVDKDHYKAEIKYRNEEGKTDTKTFQGTREQLRNDIDAQKDLPASERDHLLQALDLPRHPWEVDLPGVRFIVPGIETSSPDQSSTH